MHRSQSENCESRHLDRIFQKLRVAKFSSTGCHYSHSLGLSHRCAGVSHWTIFEYLLGIIQRPWGASNWGISWQIDHGETSGAVEGRTVTGPTTRITGPMFLILQFLSFSWVSLAKHQSTYFTKTMLDPHMLLYNADFCRQLGNTATIEEEREGSFSKRQ